MPTYYDRQPITHLDGTLIFKSAEDEKAEEEIAAILEAAWGCTLHSWGRLAPVDWWAERYGRVVGYLELKARSHDSSKYPTVYLNQRKWLSLLLLQQSGPPSIFVVKFADGVRWIPVNKIDATNIEIGGGKKAIKSRNDHEPVILVDVASMNRLA